MSEAQTATEVVADYHVPATKDYEKPTEVPHKMILRGLKDLGNVTSSFEGGEPRTRPVVQLIFKVLDQKASDNTDLLIFKRLTASLHPKSDLSKMLQKFGVSVGKDGFTLNKLIGTVLVADVEYNVSKSDPTKTFANLGAITKSSIVLPEAMRPKARAKVAPVVPEEVKEF